MILNTFTAQLIHLGASVQVDLPGQTYSVRTAEPIPSVEGMPWRDGLEAASDWLIKQGHTIVSQSRRRDEPCT